MSQVVVIRLPLPPASLSGHNKGHWRTHATLVKSMRTEAKLVAGPLVRKHKWQKAKVSYLFHMKNRRRRDVANLIHGCKPYVDGIVDTGFIPDDSWEFLEIGSAKCVLGVPGVELIFERIGE